MIPPAPATPTAATRTPAPARTPRDSAAERRTLTIGRGIRLICNVRDAEHIIVEGEFATNLVRAAELTVAQGGTFHGQAETRDAEIAGTTDGTLTVAGKLTVQSTGVLLGTAQCGRLQVDDGAKITADIAMVGPPRA